MIEMTLSSRHRIRNSSPGGLRPSTLPLGHGGSPQYLLNVFGHFYVFGEARSNVGEIFTQFISYDVCIDDFFPIDHKMIRKVSTDFRLVHVFLIL